MYRIHGIEDLIRSLNNGKRAINRSQTSHAPHPFMIHRPLFDDLRSNKPLPVD
ncbi:hypothetical protein Thivi_1446 [Thiocystis violascens DSM 198]|uniref:Uncharacterized protein n=1 Tax=Thiocystis violascens (strain ATCC 17096 / DSM 198 / 6111) TaxID=765911 RepID=I3Y8Y4_THIV6|nr:hypothetical protein Thivi_1446 [Thiocystis violascens DSM 198]